MSKVCNKCKLEKSLIDFHKSKTCNLGVRAVCKDCVKKYHKKYFIDNKESISIKSKKWKSNNKKTINEYYKKYYQSNKNKIIESVKNYDLNNQEQRKKQKKEYQKNYRKHKKKTNNLFKLRCNITNLIYISVRKRGYTKKSKTFKILGCNFEEFKLHIERQFKNWMTWENYGLYNGELDYGWDIDHIIPISSANTEEEIIKLNHYTNLQPLCSYYNRHIKTNKILQNEK